MIQPTTLFVGLVVHNDSISVVHAAPDRDTKVVFADAIGTRETDIEKLLRRLHSKASQLVVAYEDGRRVMTDAADIVTVVSRGSKPRRNDRDEDE